jgi:bifunctional pyridoxal-dependent enzyme with beta-cystathionase and maltose regulon repressor activities
VSRPEADVVICSPHDPPFFDWVPEAGARIEVPLALDDDGWALARDALAGVVGLAQNYGVKIVSGEIPRRLC